MLEHQKMVLEAVQDNEFLFKKELKKSLQWLSGNDQKELIQWIKRKFSNRFDLWLNELSVVKKHYCSVE